MSHVLDLAGIQKSAKFVWTAGLEWGEYADVRNETFQKDLPIAKALADEVLLALRINGEPLSADRGGPVRLVVPGWYGTNSVKWVGSILAADRRAPGVYTTRFYNDPTLSGPKPVWAVAPQSVIVSPDPAKPLRNNEKVVIWGWAWGDEPIASVEVSVDGVGSWHAASVNERRDRSWQRFEHAWQATEGEHLLMCRRTNTRGESQPMSGARNAVHEIIVIADRD